MRLMRPATSWPRMVAAPMFFGLNTLTLLVSMLILFYTTESLERERSTGFGAIAYSTPLRTAALLAGKALANTVLGVTIVLASFIGSLGMLAWQGHVPLDPVPFVLVWGLLLVPTFLVFTAFVSAVQAVTSNRYLTYTVGLAAMIVSGWAQARSGASQSPSASAFSSRCSPRWCSCAT